MLPIASLSDCVDRALMHVVTSRHNVRWPATRADREHICRRQLGMIVSFSASLQAGLGRVLMVLLRSDVLKVIESVVLLVAVFVVDLMAGWFWAKKGQSNQTMNTHDFRLAVFRQFKGAIPSPEMRFERWPRQVAACTANVASIRHFIQMFVPSDRGWTPLFRCVWDNRHIVRIIDVFPRATRANAPNGRDSHAVTFGQYLLWFGAAANGSDILFRQLRSTYLAALSVFHTTKFNLTNIEAQA